MHSVKSADRPEDALGLRVPKRTKFPGLCVKCGRTEGLVTRKRTLSYVTPSLYVAFCFGCVGMVLGTVFYFVARKTVELTMPTCPSCAEAWSRASRRPFLFLAGSIVVTMIVSGLVWKLDADRVWMPLCAGLLAVTIGPIALHFRGRKDRVWATGIDDAAATLAGLHPDVVAALEKALSAR